MLGSLVVIAVLLLVLIRILVILRAQRPSTTTDALVTDGTFGLYLGWVCVATTANTAAFLATLGIDMFPGWQWAVVGVLAVVALIGVGLGWFSRGRIAPALAISWGVVWIAVARTSGQFESSTIVWTASIVAALVLLATVLIRLRAERESSVKAW